MSDPIAYLRDLDGTGSLHACSKEDLGAMPVYGDFSHVDKSEAWDAVTAKNARIEELETFVESIGDATGPYTDLDGHRIVADARAALGNSGKSEDTIDG